MNELPILNAILVKKKKYSPKIIQFGEGNFLRAFVDWIIQQMNKEIGFDCSVIIVQPIENGNISRLNSQDNLYTLLLNGIQNNKPVESTEVIDVVEKSINPYSDYEKYAELACSEDLKYIISNTTEAGISYNEEDKLDDRPQISFPGKLAALLYKRFTFFNGDEDKGLIIIPCELIDKNGTKLKEIILKYIDLWNLETDFKCWIEHNCIFSNTLVDRIVPGFPKNKAEEIFNKLGYIDNCLVQGEIYHLWVIEDKTKKIRNEFPAGKAGLNVLFADDITPYKQRKVSILNGAHTSIVPVGYLYGIDTVRETVEHDTLGKYLKEVIFDEIVPTVNLPHNELVEFADDVITRFKNPFIRHELFSISLNSTTKYKTRILPSVLKYIEINNGSLPKKLLFSLAALIVFYRGKRGDETYQPVDNAEFIEMYNELWSDFDGSKQSAIKIATSILGLKEHWDVDLNDFAGVNEFVSDSIFDILENGMAEAVNKVM
ncbi:MAG: tagaturonate reductase [bacterium]|nr:tagaturonate reductase [bacterium]